MGVGRCADTHFLLGQICNVRDRGFIDFIYRMSLESIIPIHFNCNMRIVQSFTKMI